MDRTYLHSPFYMVSWKSFTHSDVSTPREFYGYWQKFSLSNQNKSQKCFFFFWGIIFYSKLCYIRLFLDNKFKAESQIYMEY